MTAVWERMGTRKPLAAGAMFAVAAVIVLVALVMPKMAAVKTQQKALDASVAQGQQLSAQVAQLEQAKREAASVKRRLDSLEQQIPATVQLPLLIREVRKVADKAAVDFIQISPGNPTPSTAGSFSTIPTQITATGNYFAVTEFLYRLETLPRAVKVTTITLAPGPDGLPELQLQLSTEMYTTDMSAGPGSQPGPTDASSAGTDGTTSPTATTTTTGGA
jgi:Tfp pilus assembly protein PilO